MSTRSRLVAARLPGVSNPPGLSDLVEIVVENGRVLGIEPCSIDANVAAQRGDSTASNDQHVEYLDGMLLLPPLHEHHAHLDKVLTADTVINRTGDLMGAIDAWIEAERSGVFGLEEMQVRAESAMERMLFSGVTSVRTHVNVGASDPDLRNLRAVSAARDRFKDVLDVEIVALSHSPLAGPEGRENRKALDKAIEFGIDLIGGCPHLEPDSVGMIEHVLNVAEQSELNIDLHVDETLDPDMLTIETLARAILSRGQASRVTASHCVSLSVLPESRQASIAKLLHEARVHVVALPQTNLFLQGWDHPQSMPRGITPITLLAEHGVAVSAGGDNVQDPFNPMGRFDPLETAALLVMAAHMTPMDAFAAVSSEPQWLGDPLRDLIGLPANFLVVDAANVRDAVASAPSSRRTVRGGRVVASSTVERTLTMSRPDRTN